MDFFKSVFSEDPDPSDLQKDHKSPSQSPKKQDPNQESTLHDTELHTNTNPNDNPIFESSSGVSGGAGAWNFGGIIKTLASKSETVIQTYRRDLEEFGSGLKKETAAIRDAASRAVKELPASIEVGASVAQESLESVGNVIDELGSSVWRGTSEIISSGKESLLSLDLENDSSFDDRNSKPYSRFEMQLHAIQNDLSTYTEEPDDLEDFGKWKLGFVLEEKGEEIESLIGEDGVLDEVYKKLVPSVVDRATFWNGYFYRVYKLKQAEDARANLVKRAISGEEEDLSWDVDDDENNGYEAKSSSSGVNEEKSSSSGVNEEESSSSGVNEEKKEIVEPVIEIKHNEESEVRKSDVLDREISDKTIVMESISDNAASDKVNPSELDSGKLVIKPDEKSSPVGKNDHGESSKGTDLPVVASQPSLSEEEDIGWDEIEDVGSNDDTKVGVVGSPNKPELRKRLSAVDDEEDLSWDIEDDEEPAKH